jgi:phage repressor protein C with HTH and peptisase S24 domain
MGTPVFKVNRFSGFVPRDNTGMSIGNRVKQARKALGLTQTELAKRSSLKQSSISDLEVGKSQGTTYLASLAATLGVSALWLETGKGSMAGEMSSDDVLAMVPGARRVHAVDGNDDGLTQIMKVQLKVQAGMTGFQVEPEHHDGRTTGVPTEWIRHNQFTAGDLIAISVTGQSMEPALYDGDVIIFNAADKQLVDGAVYVVNYEGEVVVKRMMRDAGMWWLSSDNSDQRKYHRKACKGGECIVIGRVVRKESTHI